MLEKRSMGPKLSAPNSTFKSRMSRLVRQQDGTSKNEKKRLQSFPCLEERRDSEPMKPRWRFTSGAGIEGRGLFLSQFLEFFVGEANIRFRHDRP
jgi:hypothetical protein